MSTLILGLESVLWILGLVNVLWILGLVSVLLILELVSVLWIYRTSKCPVVLDLVSLHKTSNRIAHLINISVLFRLRGEDHYRDKRRKNWEL